MGVDEDDRDPRLAKLIKGFTRTNAAVSNDEGRFEGSDGLNVEGVTVLGDDGKIVQLFLSRRDGTPDDLVPHAQSDEGTGEGAVEVEGQDPRGVGDRHRVVLDVGDRDGQLLAERPVDRLWVRQVRHLSEAAKVARVRQPRRRSGGSCRVRRGRRHRGGNGVGRCF